MANFYAVILTALIAAADPVSLVAEIPQSTKHSTGNSNQAVNEKDLLWWLPADTESVVAARGPFFIPIDTSEKDEKEWFTKRASAADIRAELVQLPLELFYEVGLSDPLRGYTVAYAMQGSRHFRYPSGGSEVTDYEGCSIVVFGRNVEGLENTIRRSTDWKGASKAVISGSPVLIWHQKTDDTEWEYLLAFPKPNVLLVANDRKYLSEVLERMSRKKMPRALPDQLPEWNFLDNDSRFWGLRHYDPAQAKDDPTSPLGADSAYVQSDPSAIGVLYALDPKNVRRLVVTSLSRDDVKTKAVAKQGHAVSEPQEGVKYEIGLLSPAPGVLEEVYTLDRSSTLDYCLLAIQFSLGRGMNF